MNPFDVGSDNESATKPDSDLREQVSKLETRVSILESRVGDLESSDASVSTEVEAYGIARTRFGPFAVVSRGVTPYLDGFKIKLAIGNLTTATFSGAKLRVTWGPPFDERNPEKFFKNQKHREVGVATSLSPGAYSIVEVIVTPARPEEVKSVSVGIDLNAISIPDKRGW